MRIRELFERDIARHLNGVVKADQLDESSVWQELDEFVVTRELKKHFRQFFASYREALDRSGDPAVVGNTGVWVSGFFGSGKSHFIKVLSYLLKNDLHRFQGESRHAVSFFDDKINDAMLLGDIKRAAASSADVILFNIDSKANRTARDPLLQVFVRVLNEFAGYSGDYPHIASIERQLDRQGQMRAFHDAYREATGEDWEEVRDAWHFYRDEVVSALSVAVGQSVDACEKLLDTAEEQFPLTIENFCEWVRDFIDRKGKNHRIVFLVDEIGQFIGADTQLMLRLQTITEKLGTTCGGRAWIVVTSQEDIDKVVGSVEGSKANDFSKIQGRFRTRLSLSSANVDEVIQKRLLNKRPEVRSTLESEFRTKGDILKNQLSFRDVGMTLAPYDSTADFVRNYPIAPYQFKLLQKIFEAIRTAGATGLHLAQGERSLLDAFQQAIQLVSDDQVGILIPLYRFYPAIENFLDTTIKRTIVNAANDRALEPFDAKLLQILFLVRYVTEIKGNTDNLVTLCLNKVDTARLELRKQVEASLGRLEKQTLISRNGDIYKFLTSDEQAINRKIGRTELENNEVVRSLGKLIFKDVFDDTDKHRYKPGSANFKLHRVSDGSSLSYRAKDALTVSVITPLADDYERYADPVHCVHESNKDGGQVLICLDDTSFDRELKSLLRAEKYLRTQDDSTLAGSIRKIHQDIAEQNRSRRKRLIGVLSTQIGKARYFIGGTQYPMNSQDAVKSLSEALDYLIANTFHKMGYLDHLASDPLRQAKIILRRAAAREVAIMSGADSSNLRALDDLREHLNLRAAQKTRVVLAELIARYFKRPYGWPDEHVILLLARLSVEGEVHFLAGSVEIEKTQLAEQLTSRRRWKDIIVRQRKRVDKRTIVAAQQLGHRLFGKLGPKDDEDRLASFLKTHLAKWQDKLEGFRERQRGGGHYPGRAKIDSALRSIGEVLRAREANVFLKYFVSVDSTLLVAKKDVADLAHFYEHQWRIWDRLVVALRKFMQNEWELKKDTVAAGALQRLREIRAASEPYGMIKEVDELVRKVDRINDRLLAERRSTAEDNIGRMRQTIEQKLESVSASVSLDELLAPLQALAKRVAAAKSIAHIAQAEAEAARENAKALDRIKRTGVRPEPLLIYPSHFVDTGYLETEQDVDAFLEKLRRELQRVISENTRIEIR